MLIKFFILNKRFLSKGFLISTLLGHSGSVLALTLLPNGFIASGSADSTIKIWDITKTDPLFTLTDHSGQINALTLINNDYLVSCSNDKTIKLWSLSSYSIVKSWTASTLYVNALAFDSTLNVLASGDNAKLVKVWDSSIWTNIKTTTAGRYILRFILVFITNRSFSLFYSNKK